MADISNVKENLTPPQLPGDSKTISENQSHYEKHLEKLADARVQIELQRIRLRKWACTAAGVVVALAMILEVIVIRHILYGHSEPNSLLILLAITPIVSITFVMVFVLVGVFRGFRRTDLNSLPMTPMTKAMFENGA